MTKYYLTIAFLPVMGPAAGHGQSPAFGYQGRHCD